MSAVSWKIEDDILLIEARLDQSPMEMICALTKRTSGEIYERVKTLGLLFGHPQRLTDRDLARISALAEAKKRVRDIALELKLPLYLVLLAHKAGVVFSEMAAASKPNRTQKTAKAPDPKPVKVTKVVAIKLAKDPRPATNPWVEKDDASLRELVSKRVSFIEIGKVIGRTKHEIVKRCRYLGIEARQKTLSEAARQAVVEAARSGMTIGEAGRTFGRDSKTLKAIAERAGVRFPTRAEEAARRRTVKPAPIQTKAVEAIDRTDRLALLKATAKKVGAIQTVAPQKPQPVKLAKGTDRSVVSVTKAKKAVETTAKIVAVSNVIPPVANASRVKDKIVTAAKPATVTAPALPKATIAKDLTTVAKVDTSTSVAAPAEKSKAVATQTKGRSSYGSFKFFPKIKKVSHAGFFIKPDKALAIETADAVAKFLAEKGVTRVDKGPADAAVEGLQRRGYSVVKSSEGWRIDERLTIADESALIAYAQARSIQIPLGVAA